MKKHVLALIFIINSFSAFSQARVLSGYFPNGMAGYKYYDTLKSLNYTRPLYAVNDTTAGMDTSAFTVASLIRNGTNDSIILSFLNGRRLAVLAGATSGGGGTGTAAGISTQVQYNDGGVFGASSRFTYYPNAGVNIIGGKDSIYGGSAHEETALTATTSDTTKTSLKIVLNNTSTQQGGPGQNYELRSLSDGSFDIFNRTSQLSRFRISKTGGVAVAGYTATNGSGLTIAGGNMDVLGGGLKVSGGFSIGPYGAGPEIEWDGTQSYFSSVNRSSGFQVKPINIRTSGVVIGFNQTVDASLLFDVQTTTKGSRPVPAMTTAQRDAIASKATWMQVICTDCTATDASTGVLQVWNGTAWKNAW